PISLQPPPPPPTPAPSLHDALPIWQHMPRRRARADVVLPAGPGDVAAHDAFERQHLEPPADRRAAVGREPEEVVRAQLARAREPDRKSTRLNSSHVAISYAVFCLQK